MLSNCATTYFHGDKQSKKTQRPIDSTTHHFQIQLHAILLTISTHFLVSLPLTGVPKPPITKLALEGGQIQTVHFRLVQAHLAVSALVSRGAEGPGTVGAEVPDHVRVFRLHVGLEGVFRDVVTADVAVQQTYVWI